MQTIRAVDIGYGHVKYVISRSEREIRCGMFPSLAPVVPHLELATGMDVARDTVAVEIDGIKYEVGPGARLGLKANHTRILHGDYVDTPEYAALALGALSYMQVPHIDLLVVGLPVGLLTTKARVLAERLKGRHGIGGGREVTVDHVWVLAQPLGGFLDHAMGRGRYETLADQVNLIIDPGYYTVDWLTGLGLNVMPERTGSFAGGMHALLKAIARGVGTALGVAYTDFDAIDRALEMGTLRVGARQFDLTPHWRPAEAYISEAVNAIHNSVGDALDVHNIILVGGGARYYEAAIRNRFPAPRLIVAADPVYANVRGFQIAGEHYAARAA